MQNDLIILQQLHHQILSLESEQKDLKASLEAKETMLRNFRVEIDHNNKKQTDEVSMLFIAAQTFDAHLEEIEITVPPKTPELSIEEMNVTNATVDSLNAFSYDVLPIPDENLSPINCSLSEHSLNNRLLSLHIIPYLYPSCLAFSFVSCVSPGLLLLL